MTTIAAGLPVRAATTTVDAKKMNDPAGDELVGKGSGFARFMGGAAGAGVGIGAMVGLTALAGRSPAQPVRIGAAILGLGAIGAGGFFGQKLMGDATRQTASEHAREATANREDLAIKYRIDVAEAGGADRKKLEEARKLQGERTKLAKAGPDQGFIAKWGLPTLLGIGAAAAATAIAIKFTPDDGKGINQMFNAMMAMPAGGAAGAALGAAIGDATMPGTRFTEIPADDATRIREIDAKLDELLGPKPA